MTALGDPFARWLGMELEEVSPGYARLSMRLTPEMLNQHGVAHGGAIFALADAAHAAASNSHGPVAVALSMSIHYVAPGRPGRRLVAEAKEEDLGNRTALYHITVRDAETQQLLASCQGRVFRKT